MSFGLDMYSHLYLLIIHASRERHYIFPCNFSLDFLFKYYASVCVVTLVYLKRERKKIHTQRAFNIFSDTVKILYVAQILRLNSSRRLFPLLRRVEEVVCGREPSPQPYFNCNLYRFGRPNKTQANELYHSWTSRPIPACTIFVFPSIFIVYEARESPQSR